MNSEDKDRLAWLARRKKGIGASDSPNILDMTQWGSALTVYLDKIGEGIDFEMNERMEIGLDIEDAIIKIFKKKTGLEVDRVEREVWSDRHPFLFATPDGIISGQKAGLECKNIGIYKKEEWADNIPFQYMIQCQHSMLVTGYEKWYLAALFGGNRFEYYEVNRDQSLIDTMKTRLSEFWKGNVLNRIPPEAQSTDGSAILHMHPYGNEDSPAVQLNEDTNKIMEDYEHAKLMEKTYKKNKDECLNIIKQRIGDNKFGETSSRRITWSRWSVKKIDGDRLKSELPEVYKEYLKDSMSGRLTISDMG